MALDRLTLAPFGDGRLVPFVDSLWTAATPIRFAGSWFPHVMTVVRLDGDQLLVHSPFRPSTALVAVIANLGSVAHVVAPNWFHDLYLAEYRNLYPNAVFWGPAMLRGQHGSTLIDCILNQGTRPPWADQMPHFTLSGLLTFNETIFFHTPSQTLIVADLLTNVSSGREAPALTRLGYRFLALDGKLKIFPIIRWFGFTNKSSLKQAGAHIIGWKPDRVIVGHGTPIEGDALGQLQAAFQRLAGAIRPREQ